MNIVSVALQVPLRKTFDYSATGFDINELRPGIRLLVPFGRQKHKVGILLEKKNSSSIANNKLKAVSSIVDKTPIFSESLLEIIQWSADYYHHPIGEALFNALPVLLRQGKEAKVIDSVYWQLSQAAEGVDADSLERAPRQKAIMDFLASNSEAQSTAAIRAQFSNCDSALAALEKKSLVNKTTQASAPGNQKTQRLKLNPEQKLASSSVNEKLDQKQVFLLDGITGSGKTEVYIDVIEQVIAEGKQALVLSPEIGLTPQFVERIQQRLPARTAVLHSGLSATERLRSWLEARDGTADIVIGTRSAVWTPLRNPGVIIIDEEHDLSYKQQDGFRYSAKDVAIVRASFASCPVILGSATPSMESLHNVKTGKFQLLKLEQRAGSAIEPSVEIIDLRNRAMNGAISQVLLNAIRNELEKNRQVMLFLNRRGYSPAFMCHHCAWLAKCERCETNMTYHKKRSVLSCHHCGKQTPAHNSCPVCQSDEFVEIGFGTERIYETLSDCFPQANILRIDRDSTRRKGSMEEMLGDIVEGKADILVGTQMLAKGHHFPRLTLVGIVDIDSSLCSMDFRASERMAQLFVQVSGRAGRDESRGKVLLQTHFPDHPLLNSLIARGYRSFADSLLQERKDTALPPFSFLALLRSEGTAREPQLRFLEKARELLQSETADLQVLGPYPAPMEKKAGKTRMQLLLTSNARSTLNRVLKKNITLIDNLPLSRKVRWSIDVDPQEMM